MSNTQIKNVLAELLDLQIFPPDFYIPIGKFSLLKDLQLARILLEEFAKRTKQIPTYEEFVELHQEPKFKEKEPKLDDPKFKRNTGELPQKVKLAKQLYFYTKAKHEYDKRYNDHEKACKRQRHITQGFNPSLFRYIQFACSPAFATSQKNVPKSLAKDNRFFFTSTHNFHLKESDRQKHTYITAQTGHGKSVTIETLINQYLIKEEPQEALILLDPHGDLALDCARLLPNRDNERLIYIKPALDRKLTPTLNPFNVKSVHWDDINKSSESLIEVFKELMQADKDGSSFTPQMITVLKPCISALLQMEGSSFIDLVDFLSEDINDYKTYLNFAKRVLKNPMHIDALNKDFTKDTFRPSKLSIKTKIRNLLNDDYFYNFLVGQNTFDLEEAIEDKKFIIFDLSGLTEKSKIAIGRFIIATITDLALARANKPVSKRTPIHLFIDECHNFVSDSMKTILTEARKFKLHGTFAQQFAGQGMNTELKKTIISNSFIKIVGNNGVTDLKLMKDETGIPVDDFQSLDRGFYYIKAGSRPAVRVKVPMVQKKGKMTWDEWNIILKAQKERFYRPIFENKNDSPTEQINEPTPPEIIPTIERKPQALKEAERIVKKINSSGRGKNLKIPEI